MYDWLLTVHVLAAALWFGSGVAIGVIGRRALAAGTAPFGAFSVPAAWWAGRAHPAAGVVLLLTGPGMVADADIGFGTTWVVIALIGLLLAFGVGGALISRTSAQLVQEVETGRGADSPLIAPLGRKLLAYSALEVTIVGLVIADMVLKPG